MKKIIKRILKEKLGFAPVLMEPPLWVKADFSSNFLFKISKERGTSPEVISKEYIDMLSSYEFKDIFFAKPGFLNFVLSERFILEEFEKFCKIGFEYFKENIEFDKKKVLIECISANPTGPLHIGHGRGGIIGDILKRIFNFIGVDAKLEYYVNDRGKQIEILGESLKARYEGKEIKEYGYKGDYLIEIAEKLKKRKTEISNWEKTATDEILNIIKSELESFGMEYDSFFYESYLYKEGIVEEVKDILKNKGLIYEKDGALWFRAKDFGDTKDRVIIKDGGTPTYFLSDVAYHYFKIKKGYQLLINIWGADHHGYVKRIEGSIKATTGKKDILKVILYQLVRLQKKGEYVSMSTRDAEFVKLKDVIDEVGKDVTRFYLILKRYSTHLDFDLEKAKQQSMDNPVYYIQYAHARICSIFKKAEEKGFSYKHNRIDFSKLKSEKEKDIMKHILFFPDTINFVVSEFDPYFLMDYLTKLATLFHNYYNHKRIIGDDNRIFFVKKIRDVIALSLNLMGIEPMEKM